MDLPLHNRALQERKLRCYGPWLPRWICVDCGVMVVGSKDVQFPVCGLCQGRIERVEFNRQSPR